MKRVFSFVLMLVLCISLACPAFAANNNFVPSITAKPTPGIIPVEPPKPDKPDDKDDSIIKIIIGLVRKEKPVEPEGTLPEPTDSTGEPTNKPDRDKWGEIIDYVDAGCLVITSVAEAEVSKAIPQKAKEVLLEIYQELSSGRMKLPYEKLEGYSGETMVIRELLDASWLCVTDQYDHNHEAQIAPKGVVFEITLDLGIKPEDQVNVMTYQDGEWEPIVDVVNNGDGTMLCVFEQLGPIAISVAQPGTAVPQQSASILPWVLVMVGALTAAIVLIVVYGKRKKQ